MVTARSILIAEDEPLIAMMLEDFLVELGHKALPCCDNLEATLNAIGQGGFDLAILDVNLRGEKVWPAAVQLREQDIPIVLASGGHPERYPEGFDAVPMLTKPYSFDSVQALLESIT